MNILCLVTNVCKKMRVVVLVAWLFISLANSHDYVPCDVRARTESGWVCGLRRWSASGVVYASFRGVPYAKQPIGELRFKVLQPLEPWKNDYDARNEGPVCPQHDEVYGYLTNQEYGMSEACIHANIHVPLHALPQIDKTNIKNHDEKTSERITHDLPNYGQYHEKEFEIPLLKYKNKHTDEKVRNEHENQKHHEKEQFYDYQGYYNNLNKVPPPILQHGYQNDEKQEYKYKFQEDIGEYLYNLLKDKPEDNKNESNVLSNQDFKTDVSYFWPQNEKPESVKDVKHIIDTWPKYQEQDHEKVSIHTSNKDRNKREKNDNKKIEERRKFLPILVYIHGGGFTEGSGDADLNGPEYLVSKDVIVITFNYRLNVFGFLSLNTSDVPGNAGLRDQITLLHWVQRNAKHFGGDPDNVTLMGQSAGAACAHLLSLSVADKKLFKRVWLLSGTGYQAFYAASPINAATVRDNFLSILGITATDPEEIHKQLIHTPIKRIVEANSLLEGQYGLISFSPVVESKFYGVKPVLDKEPEILIAEGRGKEYPLIIGYTTVEAETFRRRLDYTRYVSRIVANPRLFLPASIPFTTPPKVSLDLGEKVKHRCFGDNPNIDGLVRCYTEAAFQYQALRLARERSHMHAAPTYLYQFSYDSDYSLVKKGLRLEYKGAAHVEDLTYIFRVNSLMEPKSDFPPKDKDDMMRDWMSAFVVNFMHCSDPTCTKDNHKSGWPSVSKDHLVFEDIAVPYEFRVTTPTHKLIEIIKFYDTIYAMSGLIPANKTKLQY